MYCSGCGQALAPGQGFCPQCGRPAAPPVPPIPGGFVPGSIPGFEFQLQNYAGRVKALAVVWFIYAGLSLILGVAGLAVAHAFLSGHFGPWMGNSMGGSMGHPMPNLWFWPMILRFAWLLIGLRSVLAVVAGWGLLTRSEWGRIVAIVAAFLSLLKFPLGTALGIWTLVTLLGCRNSTLYSQLGKN